MRLPLRPLALVPVAVLSLGVAWLAVAPTTGAATPTVTMYDNDARPPNQGFEPAQGWWGYAPIHLDVRQGEAVLFQNPATNRHPHTVTSITREGPPYVGSLVAGGRFDSSPTQEALVQPGQSWTLETASMDAGHYAYYCRLHLWMVCSLTITP